MLLGGWARGGTQHCCRCRQASCRSRSCCDGSKLSCAPKGCPHPPTLTLGGVYLVQLAKQLGHLACSVQQKWGLQSVQAVGAGLNAWATTDAVRA